MKLGWAWKSVTFRSHIETTEKAVKKAINWRAESYRVFNIFQFVVFKKSSGNVFSTGYFGFPLEERSKHYTRGSLCKNFSSIINSKFFFFFCDFLSIRVTNKWTTYFIRYSFPFFSFSFFFLETSFIGFTLSLILAWKSRLKRQFILS